MVTTSRALGYWGDPKIPAAEASRNLSYEFMVLEEIGKEVRRRTGEEVPGFVRLVQRRLEYGAQVHGEGSYLHQENWRKIQERIADAAAYALLELERLNVDPDEQPGEGAQHYLFEAIVWAAVAELRVRQAIRVIQGV